MTHGGASSRTAATWPGVLLFALAAAPALTAQQADPGRALRPEVRVDALVARRTAVHVGAGATARLGNYVRVGADVGAGPLFAADRVRLGARADAFAHFLFDPLGQRRRAPYVGGGLTLRRDAGRTRGAVLALVGVEMPRRRGLAPALELGLGDGVRVGVALRRAR